jgi:hypothetical protein
LFFFGGAIALFVLVRRYLGRLAALVAVTVLVANQLYYNAETWDYVDGAVVTFLLVGFAFMLTRATSRTRIVELFAGGFFIMAGVATNIFSVALALPFISVYIAVNYGRRFARQAAVDGIALAAGAGFLLFVCCVFAWRNGAHWWFLEPQIRATSAINPASYRAKGYGWVVHVPRLIAPLLLLAAGAVVIVTVARETAAERLRWRFAVGAWTYLLLCEGFYIAYELSGSAPLEYSFYESLLLPAMAIAAAVVVYGAAPLVRSSRSAAVLVFAATIAAIAPTLVIYWPSTTRLVGSLGSKITLAVAIATIVLAGASGRSTFPHSLRRSVAISMVALLVFGVNFSMASSPDVYHYERSRPGGGAVYDVGQQLVRFLREGGFQQGKRPFFWFRAADGHQFAEVESLYFFSYSYLGASMPRIDADFKARAGTYTPETIVLLCAQHACHDAPRALVKHGYKLDEAASRLLASEEISMWARVFRVQHAPS